MGRGQILLLLEVRNKMKCTKSISLDSPDSINIRLSINLANSVNKE